jgi:Spy/CpxP family protein refolding chaperone
LTAPQAHQVDSIFALNEARLDSLRNRVAPQLDSLRDQMRASISTVLTPAQRTKFTEMSRRFDERRRASGAHDHEGRDGAAPPRD